MLAILLLAFTADGPTPRLPELPVAVVLDEAKKPLTFKPETVKVTQQKTAAICDCPKGGECCACYQPIQLKHTGSGNDASQTVKPGSSSLVRDGQSPKSSPLSYVDGPVASANVRPTTKAVRIIPRAAPVASQNCANGSCSTPRARIFGRRR